MWTDKILLVTIGAIGLLWLLGIVQALAAVFVAYAH